MDPRVAPLAALYGLNTDLVLNCLEGLSDAEAQRCLAGGGNSVAFLAAHVADTRHFLVKRLGHPLANPLDRYLAEARTMADVREWPTLDQIRGAWLAVSSHLQEVLAELTAPELDEANVHRFPSGDSTRLGLIAFLVQHDSYHLGQIAFLRKQLGKPAMAYARGTAAAAAQGDGRA
jgi:uncharacterized damage-inducible protein DinB